MGDLLKKTKDAMGIKTSACDGEIAGLIDAGAHDLIAAGVRFTGTVSFEATQSGITDNSTLTDNLVIRAIITYVRMLFRSPDDFDRLRAAYREQKGMLMHASAYTDYDGSDDDGQGSDNQPDS